MSQTLGIHWIATTFGTWLHGDPRGSWRRGVLIGPDPFLEEAIRDRMHADAVVFSPREVVLVAETFGRAIAEQSWPVLAATLQPTHVHLVFAPLDTPIEKVIATLKYRSAKAVLADCRQRGGKVVRSIWTHGQFDVFIFDEEHLTNCIAYVRRHNVRGGLVADPYPWITPHPPGPKGPAI